MGVAIVVETTGVAPLHLTIERESSGGATGLTPQVAVRDLLVVPPALASYLDWDDMTFKTAGWTEKYRELDEYDAGQYTTPLDISALGLSAGAMLSAEYRVSDGGDDHVASDVIIVQTVGYDSSIVRKAVTNRQEEFGGDPGRIILFDDDGTTKVLEQELRDGANDGIDLATRVPAKRTANILP